MNPNLLCFCAALLILFTACKKDDIKPVEQAKKITVQLDQQYVTVQKIDSAILILEWPGLLKRTTIEVKDNRLETTLSQLSQTAAKKTIQLFTKTTFNGQQLQFEREVALTPASVGEVSVNGPASITDASWKPRVILDHQLPHTRYTAVVALRASDPYFEIMHLPAGYNKRIKVFRGFFKNDFTVPVHGRSWDCGNNCSGNIVDRELFRNLPAEIANLDWNKAAIEVSYYTSNTTIDELHFTYDR